MTTTAAPADPDSTLGWRRNLALIWISQFFSLMGFNFALPFAAYRIQAFGVTDPALVKLYTGLFQAAAPLTLAIFGPIWGLLGDRYGRRPMMLRANIGATLVLLGMGMADSLTLFLLLRIFQGVFTGTVSAAQALASTSTPERRQGLAFGALSTALFGGMMAGSILGGYAADYWGYDRTFLLGSAITSLSIPIIVFGVRERFIRPAPAAPDGEQEEEPRARLAWPRIETGLPILVLISMTAFARQFDGAMMPLFVQELHGGIAGAAIWNGRIGAAACLGSMIAGFLMGRLCDRIPPTVLGKLSALGAMLCTMLEGISPGLGMLIGARMGLAFFAGGLDPVFQVWLARSTPPERRGSVIGWAVTSKSLAWMAAALLSAGAAAIGGEIRVVFFIAALAFFLIVPIITWATRLMLSNGAEARTDEPPAPAAS